MGTSAGAITGSLFCAGMTPLQVAEELSRLPPRAFVVRAPHARPGRARASVAPFGTRLGRARALRPAAARVGVSARMAPGDPAGGTPRKGRAAAACAATPAVRQ